MRPRAEGRRRRSRDHTAGVGDPRAPPHPRRLPPRTRARPPHAARRARRDRPREHPQAAAIDDGARCSTTAALPARSTPSGGGSPARHRRRRPGRRPDLVRHRRPVRRDPRRARGRRRLRPGRRRRPRRARRTGVRRGRGVRGARRRRDRHPARHARAGGPGAPGPDDDAWIIFTSGSTGKPEGRRGQPPAPPRRSSTPRPRLFLPTSRSGPATGCSPGCRSPSTPPARRCGWPGGTAPAWCRRRARWSAPVSTSAVAGRAADHGGLHGADARRAVAGRTRSRTSGC